MSGRVLALYLAISASPGSTACQAGVMLCRSKQLWWAGGWRLYVQRHPCSCLWRLQICSNLGGGRHYRHRRQAFVRPAAERICSLLGEAGLLRAVTQTALTDIMGGQACRCCAVLQPHAPILPCCNRMQGGNAFGQLGTGDTTTRPAPILVQSGNVFSMVSAGSQHTCGVLRTGDAVCWGKPGLARGLPLRHMCRAVKAALPAA